MRSKPKKKGKPQSTSKAKRKKKTASSPPKQKANPPASQPESAPVALNQNALAAALDVSVKTIQTYRAKGLPCEQTGKVLAFDLSICKKWIAANIPNGKNSAPIKSENLLEAQRRKYDADAELKEMELAQKKGELISTRSGRRYGRGRAILYKGEATLMERQTFPTVGNERSRRSPENIKPRNR